MEEITVFKTSDGKVFEDKLEAKRHQEKVTAKEDEENNLVTGVRILYDALRLKTEIVYPHLSHKEIKEAIEYYGWRHPEHRFPLSKSPHTQLLKRAYNAYTWCRAVKNEFKLVEHLL